MPFGVTLPASSKYSTAEEVRIRALPVPELITKNKTFQAAFSPSGEPQSRTKPVESHDPVVVIQLSGQQDAACPAPWGLVSTIMEAYNRHYELVLRPDDVWQAILTQLSFYVSANAEALRSRFVNFEGKMTLEVFMQGTLFTADFAKFAERMVDENIVKNLKDPEMVDWLLPAFTTTTVNDRLVAAISVMSTLQHYFQYVCRMRCGIPKVTLLGTLRDWEQLRQKADHLVNFDLEDQKMSQWLRMLGPVLDQFVASASGSSSLDFWDKVCCHRGGGSGPTYLSGWVAVFAVFDKDGKWQGDAQEETTGCKAGGPWPSIETGLVPAGTLRVPVLVDDNGTQYETQMVAGA